MLLKQSRKSMKKQDLEFNTLKRMRSKDEKKRQNLTENRKLETWLKKRTF